MEAALNENYSYQELLLMKNTLNENQKRNDNLITIRVFTNTNN